MNRKKLIKKVAKKMARNEGLNYLEYKAILKESSAEIVDMVEEGFRKMYIQDCLNGAFYD